MELATEEGELPTLFVDELYPINNITTSSVINEDLQTLLIDQFYSTDTLVPCFYISDDTLSNDINKVSNDSTDDIEILSVVSQAYVIDNNSPFTRRPKYKLSTKLCLYCTNVAEYGYQGKKRTCCLNHKSEGMVEIVTYKYTTKCKHTGCKSISRCGYPGEKVIYCDKHKVIGMYHMRSSKCDTKLCYCISVFQNNVRQPWCKKHQII